MTILAATGAAQTKEYIRLGGRVIAIESPAPLPAPTFTLAANSSSVSVSAGGSFSMPITVTPSGGFTGIVTFTFTVTNGLAIGSPQFTAVNITGTAPVSTTFSGSIPANATLQTYAVTVTGTNGSLTPAAPPFNLVVTAPAVVPQSVNFVSFQYLSGSTPASLDSLTNWRFETRLHADTSLAGYTSVIVGLGSTRLLSYRLGTSGSAPLWSIIFQGGSQNAEVYVTDNTDVLVRVQRTGATVALRIWKVEANGTLTYINEATANWVGATLSPGFSLGAATDQATPSTGRLPSNGRMAYFRLFDSVVSSATLPDVCDSSSALIRYEFESNLTNTGTANAPLTASGTLGYQPTPGSSCAIGGSSFTLVPGTQSPSPVTQGQPASYPVSINRQNFTGVVNFTGCSGPTGVSCPPFSTAANATSATVTVNTSGSTPVATHTVTLNASGAGVANASTNLSLNVAAPSGGGLSLTTPSVPDLLRLGGTTPTSLVINSASYTGTVTLSCPGISGVSCSPASVNVVPGSNPATLQIAAASGVASAGRYSFYVNAAGAGGVSANSPAVTLTVITCGLSNVYNTQFPMNPGSPVTLALNCSPASDSIDPYAAGTITWQLHDSAMNPVAGNTGAAGGTANSRVFTAPANTGTTVATYYARAYYNATPVREAVFPITVAAPLGVYIRPQAYPPYVLNPNGQLQFGVEIPGAGSATCSATSGTLTPATIPGFPLGYTYTAPYFTSGQVSVVISCVSTISSTVHDSFPLQVNASISVPPTVTSVTWPGPGNTSWFQTITVQGAYTYPSVLSGISLRISPTNDNFDGPNACQVDITNMMYGSGTPPVSGSWQLLNDAGTGWSSNVNVYSYYLYPAFYNLWYYYNSQCQANYVTQQNTYNNNYGPATVSWSSATYGLRFYPSFVGQHSVWGRVTVNSGLQSAWTPPTGSPTPKFTVQ